MALRRLRRAALLLLVATGAGAHARAEASPPEPGGAAPSGPPAARPAPDQHTRGRIVVRPAFEPAWASLSRHRIPEWFRDAKLGFRSHTGPQSVPMRGDSYARWLYGPYAGTEPSELEAARRARRFHEQSFGHPSRFGYADLCPAWRAERFSPAELLSLYERAGGRYFVVTAADADNFDLWDSAEQRWNSVEVGPKKDIVGLWAQAARRRSLPFGVALCSARAWRHLEPAFASDRAGPLAGVPYDGARSREDGRGRRWEGLDPRDLYGPPRRAGEPADAAFAARFYARARDLVDKYRPDLVSFADRELPFDAGSVAKAAPPSKAGLHFLADYYNASMRWHGGADLALVSLESVPDERRNAVLLGVERGSTEAIEAWPWQAETSLGDWHYRAGARYKTTREIVQLLADVVSKNGNLLLNVPQRPDGSLDAEERRLLGELAAWMDVNGAAIHDTRPWTIFGEGPTRVEGGAGSERARAFTSEDFRFTTRPGTLYAIALGTPESGRLVVRSLARGKGLLEGRVRSVTLFGHAGALEWQQTKAGLEVRLPQTPCAVACVLAVGLKAP